MDNWNLDTVEQQQLWDYLDEKWANADSDMMELAGKLIEYDSRYAEFLPEEVIEEITESASHDSNDEDSILYAKGYQDAIQDAMNTMERIKELR